MRSLAPPCGRSPITGEYPSTGTSRTSRSCSGAVGLAGAAKISVLTEMERRHPREPHHYLALIGTDPAHQGRGIGTALLEPVLARCDAEGLPAYLESSKALERAVLPALPVRGHRGIHPSPVGRPCTPCGAQLPTRREAAADDDGRHRFAAIRSLASARRVSSQRRPHRASPHGAAPDRSSRASGRSCRRRTPGCGPCPP